MTSSSSGQAVQKWEVGESEPGLDGVAASTGSACHSGRIELSPVLAAMGVAPEAGMGAIRFSLGRGTTESDIDAIADRLHRLVRTGGVNGD